MLLPLVPVLALAAGPDSWVPVRWPWNDAASLELLGGTPVNCLLAKNWTPALVRAAAERNAVVLAVLEPAADVAAEARRAAEGKLAGIVLDGDFPDGTAERVRQAGGGLAVIELPSRARMKLDGAAPLVGTSQGVWPGVQVTPGGAAKAAPTGSPWIDTNAGFLRAARAWGHAAVWLGNLPPSGMVIAGERYLQAIADAEIAGGRWIIAFDDDLARRLEKTRRPRHGRLEAHGTTARVFRGASRVAHVGALRATGRGAGSPERGAGFRRNPGHDRSAPHPPYGRCPPRGLRRGR